MNHHHVYVSSADEMKPVGTTSQENSVLYQTTAYYSPAASSYQTVPSMSFNNTGNDERKTEYLLIPPSQTASGSQLIKEHPAAVQADQMNAYIDSYFGDQHGASTSSDGNNDGDLLDNDNGLDDLHDPKKTDEDLSILMKDGHNDDIDGELDEHINMEHDDSEMGDKYREEKVRQKRAAAARSRYQRMTENERRMFNHRRRLKQLGLDPESARTDVNLVRQHVKMANAKKAEAARLRYHRMTPEQKRDYNMRRTEAFRRRRQEEEMLLSTPAGRISAEALAKAQQIMVRNARKAESARLRYQRMSPEERKQYNLKRAAAKKTRKKPNEHSGLLGGLDLDDSFEAIQHHEHLQEHQQQSQPQQHIQTQQQQQQSQPQQQQQQQIILGNHSHLIQHQIHQQSDPLECVMINDPLDHPKQSVGTSASSSSSHSQNMQNGIMSYADEPIGPVDPETQEQHMLDIINEVAMPTQHEIFAQMEKDVIKRTRQAHMVLQRQQHETSLSMDTLMVGDLVAHAISTTASNAIVGGIQYDMAPCVTTPAPQMTTPTRRGGTTGRNGNMARELAGSSSTTTGTTGGSGGMMVDVPETTIVDKTQLIDEKALHEMLRTGLDANGQPVEIRMADGTPISGTDQLSAISNGQTILITQQQPLDHKIQQSTPYGSTSTSSTYQQQSHQQQIQQIQHQEDGSYMLGTGPAVDERIAMNRAKRAERARLRYHRMSVEERREQNARRADMLRRSRQRDDQLCQIAESVPVEQIDEDTKRLIQEAQARRSKRAEQARAKYHRMNSEQRRQYNAMRDAQRRQRKREQENRMRQQLDNRDDPNGSAEGNELVSNLASSNDPSSLNDTSSSDVANDNNSLYPYEMFPSDSWEH